MFPFVSYSGFVDQSSIEMIFGRVSLWYPFYFRKYIMKYQLPSIYLLNVNFPLRAKLALLKTYFTVFLLLYLVIVKSNHFCVLGNCGNFFWVTVSNIINTNYIRNRTFSIIMIGLRIYCAKAFIIVFIEIFF